MIGVNKGRSYYSDPTLATDFERDEFDLQLFWFLCICVAGKTAVRQAKLLETFLLMNSGLGDMLPFEIIQNLIDDSEFSSVLRESKLGQYTKLEKAFTQSLTLDLKTCTVGDLEAIHGVGAKTARYFLLHSRKGQRIAVLDTHVIAHMRSLGLTGLKGTPPAGPVYQDLEEAFIKLADATGETVADYDLMIWNQRAKKA